ncbi:MAG: two-component system response regulator PhoP [Oleiphilaceae bacterium]|jgi:two-component system response regulator PhoP
MRILVVEDETILRQQLEKLLTQHQYAVDSAKDGEDGFFLGKEYKYDIAIVDLGLPKINGIELIKKWRLDNINFPILILTARGNWQDKVSGLDSGADDYLVKPFHLEELLSRVKALLRRSKGQANSLLIFGKLCLDLSAKSASFAEQKLELTAYEYNTLEYLALNRGNVISKTELTEHLYAQDYDRDSNVIEVFIGRLRKKIDPTGKLEVINTVRGQGYRFSL